jgi:hypothetical protein
MGLFGRINKKKPAQKDVKTVSYDEALRTGSSIGKLITNIWNSQKNPGKAVSDKETEGREEMLETKPSNPLLCHDGSSAIIRLEFLMLT